MDIEESIKKLEAYYRARAAGYEATYYRPDAARRAELARATTTLMGAVAGRRVLEIACGTGFWTEFASESAAEIFATDISEEMLDLARGRRYPRDNVRFAIADAYALDQIEGEFDAGVANFWLSHVPRDRMRPFLDAFHRRLGSGAIVFMMDNVYKAEYGGQFVQIPGVADTFRVRELEDGSKHTVIKNYLTEAELGELLSPQASDLRIEMLSYYWWLTYAVTLE